MSGSVRNTGKVTGIFDKGSGMVIAAAMGLHNFAEGLAIGVSARAGAANAPATPAVNTAANRCPRRLFDIPNPQNRREYLVL